MTSPSNPNRPVLIVGGGTIGLSIGWELARAGVPVTLFDRDTPGRGASWKAGGMLAPTAELQFEEPDLYRLNRESLRRWPAFVEALEEDTDVDLGFRTEGTLTVAPDEDSATAMERVYRFQQKIGADVERLSGAEARDREPFLAPHVAGAVYTEDVQVDNRALVNALREGVENHGGRIRAETPIATIQPDSTQPAVVTESGERIEGHRVIVAAGAWSRQIDGLDEGVRPPVRPVKGQVIDLEHTRPFDLRHVVRGPDAYLVPKANGRLVVGATSEEKGFETDVTAGGLYNLLEGAIELVPGIRELSVRTLDVGLRPGTRDNTPLLGPSGTPGVLYATGHYRHGILLTPVTAQEIANLVHTGTISEWLEPFLPSRFTDTVPTS
jgi:glycine oxidase